MPLRHYGQGAEPVAPCFQGPLCGGALGWGAMEESQQFTGDGLGVTGELGMGAISRKTGPGEPWLGGF